jgi:uncharacterized membrane protein
MTGRVRRSPLRHRQSRHLRSLRPPSSLRPRGWVLLLAAVLALGLAGAAAAKSFTLVESDVQVRVAKDGTLLVDEHIRYSFSGPFSGGYRDIPVRKGESVREVSVLEGGRRYTTGGCTELGCDDVPGTFGVTEADGKVRVVWHYRASDEVRTFEIRYALRGVAVAYDDVVDVDLQVWGDEWDESLGKLTATLDAPGKVLRAWGHPVWVRGDVQLAGSRVLLRALDVPAHQFVELRALIPRGAFTSTAGMRTARGTGLQKITADERDDAAAYERDHDRIENAKRHPWLYVAYVLLLGLVPALLVVAAVYWFWGRERDTGYDRE